MASDTSMNLPVEIISLILQRALDILPFKELLNTRLVSSKSTLTLGTLLRNTILPCSTAFFAREIMNSLIKSPRLENDGFLFGRVDEFLLRRRWIRFPDNFKRQYLHWKIKNHAKQPCMMSHHILEILDISNKNINEGGRGVSLDALVDAWLCGFHRPLRNMIDSAQYENCFVWYEAQQRDRRRGPWVIWEPPEQTLQIVLAVDAILRGDGAKLQCFLDEGLDMQEESTRFGVIPLQIASSRGDSNIIQVLVKNNSPMDFRYFFFPTFRRSTDALCDAARTGNVEALNVWLQEIRLRGQNSTSRLHSALTTAIKAGNVRSVDFLLRSCRQDPAEPGSTPAFCTHCYLIDSIRAGQVEVVEFLVSTYGLGEGTKPGDALSAALKSCPAGPAKDYILRAILNHGADPNMRLLSQLPLEMAANKRDVGPASILLEHGAVMPRALLPSMLLSSAPGASSFVRTIFNTQVGNDFTWKGRKSTLRRDKQAVTNLEEVLIQLGCDKGTVRRDSTEYYILVY